MATNNVKRAVEKKEKKDHKNPDADQPLQLVKEKVKNNDKA
jgi:hypothetical protein